MRQADVSRLARTWVTAAVSEIGKRIRAARGYADLSQEELADRLGYERQAIRRREEGDQHPRRAELIAIAQVCEVPPSFFDLGGSSETR